MLASVVVLILLDHVAQISLALIGDGMFDFLKLFIEK